MSGKQYKAAVISTFEDLKRHRASAIEVVRRSGFFVDPMESWDGSTEEPKEFCRQRLNGCHVCILLVARRRGYRKPDDKRSITQHEYYWAVEEENIDVLPFFLDDNAMWHTKWDELATDLELRRWRDEIRQERGVGTFTEDPESIGQTLAPSLNRWQQEDGAKSALRLYRKSIVDSHGFIRLDDVAPEEKDRVPIKDLFIEPRVAPVRISPDWDPEWWPKTSRLMEAVVESPKLVLLGDPGSGKSTLVDWLTWHLGAEHRGRESQLRQSLGDLLPLPLILRDLDVRPGITWDKLLNSFIEKTAGGQLTLVDVRSLLRDGKALLMLDGLDEISQRQTRRDLREAVWEGMKTYPRCRWLLTSREVGYEEVPYHTRSAIGPQGRKVDAPPDEAPGEEAAVALGRGKDGEADAALDQRVELVYVAPFDDEQVHAFAENWFGQRERSETEVHKKVDEFLSAVRTNESTTRLGRIPFLLTMMAVIHRNKARLPDGRALLYGRIVDAYLEDIDARRKLEDLKRWQERLSNFGNPAGIRKRWLSRIGFEMQRLRAPGDDGAPAAWHLPGQPSGEILASKAQLQQWVSQAMKDTRYEAAPPEAGEFLDYITKRSGLLVARGEDRYAFVHLSFQEYFAACFLQEQVVSRGWAMGNDALIAHGARPGDFNRYAPDHRWRETLVFLIELMAAEKPDWLELVWPCLFGDAFADLATYREDTRSQAMLLATLASNRHSGLTGEQRKIAINRCCAWEVVDAARIYEKVKGPLSRDPAARLVWLALTSSDPALPNTMAQGLIDAALQRGDRKLDFFETGISELVGLQGLVHFREIDLDLTNVRDLTPLGTLPNLEVLHLWRTSVTDLRPLSALRSLQRLNLRQTRVSDLTPLAALNNLQYLGVAETGVSDLTPLAALSNLQRLVLTDTRVADLKPLGALNNLESLDLGGTDVTDLPPLAPLSKLKYLSLGGTKVTDIAPLEGLSNLQELHLAETGVTDVAPLAGLHMLQELNLTKTSISDLAALAALAHLRRLGLGGTNVTDVRALGELHSLEELYLWETHVTDLTPLARLHKLKLLDLDGATVTDITPLASLCKLQHLDLSRTSVMDLSPLAPLSNLEVLELNRTPVANISPLAGLNTLRHLELVATPVRDLSPVAGLTNLQSLDVSGTAIMDFTPLAGLENLESLDLSGTGVTDAEFKSLNERLPCCIATRETPSSRWGPDQASRTRGRGRPPSLGRSRDVWIPGMK